MKIGKRESQRLERRAQIIAIARQHFFERGFDNTTMSAIAADLGGSKRTLWSYFADKDELFAAMVVDTAQGLRAQLDLPTHGGDPLELLTRVSRSVIDRVLSPTVIAMLRLVGPLADRRPDLGRIFFERGPGESQRVIGDYLRDNFADILWTTDFKTAGVDLCVFASAEFHFERMVGFKLPPTNKEKDAQARHAAILFLRAYARRPDEFAPREELAATEA